jgi:hypothetical protein
VTVENFSSIVASIKKNPLQGVKVAQRIIRSVRARSYECAVYGYAFAQALKKRPILRSSFYLGPFWKGGYNKNEDHLLKHGIQFAYEDRHGAEGKRAEDHAAAMQAYFDADKSPRQMLAALKKGGFDALKKGSGARGGDDSDEDAKGSADPGDDQDDENDSDAGKNRGQTDSGNGGSQGESPSHRAKPPLSWSEVSKHLLVTLDLDELIDFMPIASQIGDKAELLIERVADHSNGLTTWRAARIKLSVRT